MPEIEQSVPQPLVDRPSCAHDPKEYRHLMPIGASLVDGKNTRIKVEPVCPYYASAGSLYCLAHSILRNTIPLELKEEVAEFLRTSIRYYAMGLLINPPLPNGTLYYPSWWAKRFN